MALHWSWAFGNESATDLIAMGWSINNTSNVALTSSIDEVYTYTDSPTRYGWKTKIGQGTLTAPPQALSGLTNGWTALPIKSLDITSIRNNEYVFDVQDASAISNWVRVTSAGALSLYIAGQFKETTAAINWLSWHYVALKWDVGGVISAGKWSAQLYVDGVAATALQQHNRAASTAGLLKIGPGIGRYNQFDSCWSQVIVWGSHLDAGETPYFATRAEPTADGINVGTWTPSTGADDYSVVASPFSTSTYTQDASPSASPPDRCEVVTSTLATALGVTPSSVIGATAHTFSEGQAVTARAIVGPSGGTETAGTTTAISASSTSYAFATSTAALTGSSTLDIVYEVVSV